MEENKNVETPRYSQPIAIVVGVVVLIIVVGVSIYFSVRKSERVSPVVENNDKPASAFTSTFATYEVIPIQTNPKIPSYSVSPDLKNVSNANDFQFSPAAKNLLVQNAFVVKPADYTEFFPLYEENRYSYVPNFVTTDSLLHNYHLIFDHLLKKLEEEKLVAELKKLNSSMLAEALAQLNALKGTQWENAAKRNVGFFAVGSKLLDPTVKVPQVVAKEVEAELALVAAHRGITPSPVMGVREDYSQYIPRGHYDKTESLKAYFKSMMWYGRLTFRLKEEDEIKSGILITLALNKNENQASWNTIYEPINFFVGKSDDITYYQFEGLVENIYGANVSATTVSSDKEKFAAFVTSTRELEPPQINSMPIFNAQIQPDREKEIKGFRFMGQRFTIDAAIFQRLVDREVPGRMLPKGLDIPAALGSKEALGILTELGETKYPNYSENMTKMQSYIAKQPAANWVSNLYWGWLNTLRPLVEEKPQGYPTFMRNKAWLRKDLNTFLGSWTELKHDTILYAKQVYAELGGGGPDEKDDRGYVEPNPDVYARLASLLKMTSAGLETRGLVTPVMKDNLAKMETLALSLKTISEKELNNQKLTDEEYELIRSYGGQLEHFWLEVNKDEPEYKISGQREYLAENPAALVADVATDPNGAVLEEGTGYISEIYVVAPVDGKLKIVKGGVYSYYEFTWPLSDRLTDKKWREMLKSDTPPALPSWTDSFTAK